MHGFERNCYLQKSVIERNGGLNLEIKFNVYYAMLEYFDEDAKKRLQIAATEYVGNIVKEAVRIEEVERVEGAEPWITDNSTIV